MNQQANVKELNYGRKVYDFMRWYKTAFSVSIFLLIASTAIIIIQGFNWGPVFTGGTIIELQLNKDTNIEKIRNALKQAGFSELIVQNFGSNHDIMIRLPQKQEKIEQNLKNKILAVINSTTNQNNIIKRIELVGPGIGNNLAQDFMTAIIASLISILIYVSIRFEWRLATGAVLALIHDIIITIGLLSTFCIEIDMTIIAALMSVMSYSLNDSIVVYDRIRENFRKINSSNSNTYDIFNLSITQTLKRTIITSATILIVGLILFCFGGMILRGFSISLFIGVLVGTISSIYVASSLALKLGVKREHLLKST